jgi:hypothetical protein
MQIKNLLFFLLLISVEFAAAQRTIRVNGKITDGSDKRIAIPGCIVVNMRTQQGILTNEDGTFTTTAFFNDTLAFRTIGYEFRYVTLKDSAPSDVLNLNVSLKRLTYKLDDIVIIPRRNLDSISQDIEKLGYDESDYMLEGVDALQSPITYLYQVFSRRERSRREVAIMLNEDERKKLMRELLRYYVESGYLPLRDRDFDPFIEFCAISEAQLKTLTQYEVAVFIKKKYENFLAVRK